MNSDFIKGILIGVLIVLYLGATGLSVYTYFQSRSNRNALINHAQAIQQLMQGQQVVGNKGG